MGLPTTWNIGLESWIIKDGNYPDFTVGETVEFAVEFYRRRGAAVTICSSRLGAQPISEELYEVVAEKVLETEKITVLDIGILVYREGPPLFPQVEIGTRFQTQVGLGVDPYFYFEFLNQIPGVPPLIYSWRMTSIGQQTAPFIKTIRDSGLLAGRTVWVRDRSQWNYQDVTRTDAQQDSHGF